MKDRCETNNVAYLNSKRIVWIDWAKVIGIYLVVLGHMPIHGKSLIYCFHMPLFFMISGYLYKHVPISKEIKKSIKSLVVPYVIYSIILLLVWGCISGVSANMFIDITLGNQELLPRIFRPLWFVVSLLFMRLVCSICKERWLLPFMIIILCISICMKEMNVLQNSYSKDYFQLQTTLVCIPFFLLGWLIKKKDLLGYANKLIVKCRLLITIALIGGGILLGLYNGMVNALTCHTGKSIIIYYIVGFVVPASLIWFCSFCFLKESKLIQLISEGTFLILAVHLSIIDGLKCIFHFSFLLTIVVSILIMGLCTLPIFYAKRYCPIILGKK